jgi:MFS transporter, FHS family, L-fucose permease
MKFRAFPVFLAFLAMGFLDAEGPFVSLAKNEFHLSNAVAFLTPFVGLSMFGLLSIPAGILQNRRGKKFVLILGLAIALAGMSIASMGLNSFLRFLFTIVLLGAGTAILQVAGNPLMRDVSPEGKYARNLSLAQFVKAIGSLSGPLIPVIAARYFGASWGVIFPIFSGALLITLVAAASLKLPVEAAATAANLRSCLALLRNPFILSMTCAIFLYIGAEVSVSAGIPLFLKESFGLEISRVGLLGTGLFFTALILGRFLGGVILNWIKPAHFLVVSCGLSLAGMQALFVPAGSVAAVGFFLTGLGFANIFPLIFAIAVDRMPERSNEVSGLLVTAIVGGAVLPPLVGAVADRSSMRSSLSVPIAAIVYVFVLALLQLRTGAGSRLKVGSAAARV